MPFRGESRAGNTVDLNGVVGDNGIFEICEDLVARRPCFRGLQNFDVLSLPLSKAEQLNIAVLPLQLCLTGQQKQVRAAAESNAVKRIDILNIVFTEEMFVNQNSLTRLLRGL